MTIHLILTKKKLFTFLISSLAFLCVQTASFAQGYLPPSQSGRTYTEPGEYDYKPPRGSGRTEQIDQRLSPAPNYNRQNNNNQGSGYQRPATNYGGSSNSQTNQTQNNSDYYGIPSNANQNQGRTRNNYVNQNNRPHNNQSYSDPRPSYTPQQSPDYAPPSRYNNPDRNNNPDRSYQNSQETDRDSQRPPYREPQREEHRPMQPPRMAQGYSQSEIKNAGHRFFGNITTGLAKVIAKAFGRNGRPNGYILGEEGGGAFVAGLQYGEGKLYTKSLGNHPIFWQGPSVGYDFGASGSKTMILVYNLKNIDFIYQKFGGVSGSAYVVGGIGITLQKRDDVTLAPIRSGVGVRLGANIGYMKYTRKPTWNPF